LPLRAVGDDTAKATIEVDLCPTPEERHVPPVEVLIDAALTVHAAMLDGWAAPRQACELAREGTDFGRANNAEAVLLFVNGGQTSSLAFRADQLDSVQDFGDELALILEERGGNAKTARLTGNGVHVELFHILM
jgi:hypothetical protein